MQDIEKAIISFGNTIGKVKGIICIFREIRTKKRPFAFWIFSHWISSFLSPVIEWLESVL